MSNDAQVSISNLCIHFCSSCLCPCPMTCACIGSFLAFTAQPLTIALHAHGWADTSIACPIQSFTESCSVPSDCPPYALTLQSEYKRAPGTRHREVPACADGRKDGERCVPSRFTPS